MKRSIMFLVALVIAAPVWAQPLADRVPADALVYVGWAGAGGMGEDFDQSHFKAVLDAAKAGDVFNTLVDLLAQKALEEEGPDAAAAVEFMRDLLMEYRKDDVRLVYLKGSADMIRKRIDERSGHFMPVSLLESQFAALEEPEDAITVDIEGDPGSIAAGIRKALEQPALT